MSTVSVVAAAVSASGLLVGAWWLASTRRLPAPRSAGADRAGSVSIVIPARNEAASLPALLSSLREGARGAGQVIVVDDGSTDATADVGRDLGATVLTLHGPPHGWAGKPHACSRGAELATGSMLLFLDADVELGDRALDRLLAAHDAHGGLISVQPHHRTERAYEQLSAMPNLVSMIGTGCFTPAPRPARPAAFGPCLLTSAADYARAGGHAAVAHHVVDDIALARAYADSGLPVHCFTGGDAVWFRMYPSGLRQLVEGWSKNIATGAQMADPRSVLVGVWFVAACLSSEITVATAVLHAGSISHAHALVSAGGWVVAWAVLALLLRRIGRFRWWTSALHIVPVVGFVAIFARSTWSTLVRRQVVWRGRALPLGGRRG